MAKTETKPGIDEYQTSIHNAEGIFAELWDRMDTDNSLYRLEDYVMKNLLTKQTEPDVINVTLNDPLTLADQVIPTLSGAVMQIVVEGDKLSPSEIRTIEELYTDLLIAIDDRLIDQGKEGFRHILAEQLCIRGRAAVRVLMGMVDGKFAPDVWPCDTRWLPHEFGIDRLAWAAPSAYMTKAQIKDEFDKPIEGSTAKVQDYWDSKWNIIYGPTSYLREKKKNIHGYPPFVIVTSGVGAQTQDEDSLKHSGESIYRANRGLYPELNRFASQVVTHNQLTLMASLQYESEAGEDANVKQYPIGPKKITGVEKGGGFKKIEVGDIKGTGRLWYAMLYSRVQQGGLPTVQWGNLSFPMSGRGLDVLKQGPMDMIYLPRINSKAKLLQRMCMMAKNQIIARKLEMDLGEQGKQRHYTWKDLDKDFSIKFKFFPESPEKQMVNLSMAAAAQPFVDDDTLRRDYLQLQDPDGVKKAMDREKAYQLHPALWTKQMAIALVDEERYQDAEIMALKGVQLLKQMHQPAQPDQQQEQQARAALEAKRPIPGAGIPAGSPGSAIRGRGGGAEEEAMGSAEREEE
jgi:hypothetical protein